MSFNLYVQQNQWLIVTLLAGVVLMILFCLTYLTMWRPREGEGDKERQVEGRRGTRLFRLLSNFMPWPLLLVILIVSAFGIIQTIMAMTHLPNW